MSSLASLFKQISHPNPVELDPEDAYHSIDAKVTRSAKNEAENYDDVEIGKAMGPSQLRKNLTLQSTSSQHPKYVGKLVSVKEWMNGDEENTHSESEEADNQINPLATKLRNKFQTTDDNNDEENQESYGNQDEQEDDDEEEEEESDDDLQDDLNEERDESTRGGTSSQSSTSTSDSRDEDDQSAEKPHPKQLPTSSQQAQDQPSDLVKRLQDSVKADIEKGQAVKNQLLMYDRILALRIGVQKPLIATNKLVETKFKLRNQKQEETDESVKEEATTTIKTLLNLSSKLGALREAFMEPVDGQLPRKRKRSNQDNTIEGQNKSLEECFAEAGQLDKRLSPYLRTTIQKWSNKINATTALNAKKFDLASRQNVMEQLDQIWASKDEREKLIQRAQTNPQSDQQNKRKVANLDEPFENRPGPPIFDDRNFYLSLLKEVVETATRNQDLTDVWELDKDYRSRRTHRANADPKASKGRKIRYDVHDKLVAVMVPIQNELWSDAQKDDLFASLLGRGYRPPTPPEPPVLHAQGFKLL